MIKIHIINENIVTEQEKITLSQIVGDNSVVSFDFDNTLVKSFPDFDEDGELIYINGGSNATMINLMKHYDLSKRVKYPQYLQVFYDGRPVHPDEWQYNDANNRVYFNPLPEGGVLVEIAYYYQPSH